MASFALMGVGAMVSLLSIAALATWRLKQSDTGVGIQTSPLAVWLVIAVVAGILISLAGVAVLMFTSVPQRMA